MALLAVHRVPDVWVCHVLVNEPIHLDYFVTILISKVSGELPCWNFNHHVWQMRWPFKGHYFSSLMITDAMTCWCFWNYKVAKWNGSLVLEVFFTFLICIFYFYSTVFVFTWLYIWIIKFIFCTDDSSKSSVLCPKHSECTGTLECTVHGLLLTLKLKVINKLLSKVTFWLNILHNTLLEDACRNTVNVISCNGVQCLLTDC